MSITLPLLIEPQDLQELFDNDSTSKESLLIVDLSREAVYQQAHVPGAIFLDFKVLLSGIQPASAYNCAG